MGRAARTAVAAIDAVIMGVAAWIETSGRFVLSPAYVILWGSAVAAALCALVIFIEGSALLAWAAIGFILFGAVLTGTPQWPLVALAAALIPLVPRPRGSLWTGLSVAIVVAFGARLILEAL
ncbi:MAG: hypothetical protein M3R54_12375 [Chloroflexota bacterium]|nr:hypothetical protein [Chloroflexota bacterium]